MFGLFFALMAAGRIYAGLRSQFGQVLSIYMAWCIASTGWSEVPSLSIMKSIAFLLTAIGFISGGYAWAASLKKQNVLDFLWPIIGLTLFAGFLATGRASQPILNGSIELYRGLTGNPNYLGALVAMSFPPALWLGYRNRNNGVWLFISGAIIVALLYLLWASASRSSLLAVAFVGLFFLISLNVKKRTMIVTLGGIFVLAVISLAPSWQETAYNRLVLKGNIDEDGAILISRQDVWNVSYLQALKGGVVGGGYGVTIGDVDRTNGISLVSAFNYGREKGNTELAVWEELGLVGLALYGWLIILLVYDLSRCLRRTTEPETRVEVGLVFGAIVGFIAHSTFEAWWVAPGAAESAYFWAMVGVASGLIRRGASLQQRSQYQGPTPITASSTVSPLSTGS